MPDAMKARVPGLSKDLPVWRDLLGRPISYRSGLGVVYDVFSPIASCRENPEPIDPECSNTKHGYPRQSGKKSLTA